MIVEKAAGISCADLIEQRIFKPLGMTHSHYERHAQIIPGEAAGPAKAKEDRRPRCRKRLAA